MGCTGSPVKCHSLERTQEVKFFPQWSGEGQKSVMSSDICKCCTCATGCQKFFDIRHRLLPELFQSPSFPYHVTKKRRALGTRMSGEGQKSVMSMSKDFVTSGHARLDVRKFLTSGNGCFHSPSFPYHVTKNRRALGTRMGVSRPFVSDTSPKCIDRDGLERRRTGTRQERYNFFPYSEKTCKSSHLNKEGKTLQRNLPLQKKF